MPPEIWQLHLIAADLEMHMSKCNTEISAVIEKNIHLEIDD